VVFLFLVFAVIVLLCQGKLVKFSRCSINYVGGFIAITAFYIIIMIGVKKYMNKKMEEFRTIGYDYEYPL